ncbi:hypothetical protein [Siccirubricoccus sp. G192]|uniref:hypothetical protein n=1 Tax=Siccirubricoccus sp. G192 TaxID=2849651 RepID=UPI0020C3C0AB|nr:hypothetical protein [Siccirubricoccus sp. G192]
MFSIDICRVEQGDACIEGSVHDGAAGLKVDSATEVVAAQADDRNPKARSAEIAHFHDNAFLPAAWAPSLRSEPELILPRLAPCVCIVPVAVTPMV